MRAVPRLKEVFGIEGVRRLEPRHHVPAAVDQSDLDAALRTSNATAESLLNNLDNDPPVLKFPQLHRLTCLHGRHRIQAARETLDPTDAWWTVDFYLKDSDPDLRTTLAEEYSNEVKPSDGEIYRKIRLYEREGNICFKKRWKARLSTHGQRGLRQLFGHRDGELAVAFDNLLDIPGLWDGMRISTIHKVMSMKCDEEVLHYLEHIRKVWHTLLRGNRADLQKVDQITVKALEGRAPRYSRKDALLLQGQLLSGQIFGAFSREQREEIWREIRSIDTLIASLHTFFEDAKYLSACSDCLKRLLKLSPGDTVFTAFRRKFPYHADEDDQVVIETAESSFVFRRGLATDRLDLGYRQLWLFAMRHYREIPLEAKKRKKDLLAKARVDKADVQVLSEFAALADRLGFESDEIQVLNQQSSDQEIARNALLKARKPDRYQYDEIGFEALVSQIVTLFASATPLRCESSSPSVASENLDASGHRCGFPDEDAQQQDSKFLFISHLHKAVEDQGEDVTSYFVRRSVYMTFFGEAVNLGTDQGSDEESGMDGFEWMEQYWQESPQTRDQGALQEHEFQEPEPVEQARQLQKRLEQERLEQERLEAARQEQERLEQERLEAERLEERLEQERLEQERLEQERLEQERLEQERLEQERLEQERLKKNPEPQEAQEQKKHERAQKRHTQIDMHSVISRGRTIGPGSLSQNQAIHEDNPRVDENASITNPQLVDHLQAHIGGSDIANNTSSQPPVSEDPSGQDDVRKLDTVRITYHIRERDVWRISHTLDVDTTDPTEVERVAIKYMRKGIRLFDRALNILTPRNCFEAATSDGNNTILLIPESEINIGEKLESSVSKLLTAQSPTSKEGPRKRGRQGSESVQS
ncbi:hypothetical protein LTS17_005381 [Exophiala oligosperma]